MEGVPALRFATAARRLGAAARASVDETLYHYPGPLPHTRETAIVMLADAVEATSRSLPNPTAQKIRQTVDHIIKKRFGDGQL